MKSGMLRESHRSYACLAVAALAHALALCAWAEHAGRADADVRTLDASLLSFDVASAVEIAPSPLQDSDEHRAKRDALAGGERAPKVGRSASVRSSASARSSASTRSSASARSETSPERKASNDASHAPEPVQDPADTLSAAGDSVAPDEPAPADHGTLHSTALETAALETTEQRRSAAAPRTKAGGSFAGKRAHTAVGGSSLAGLGVAGSDVGGVGSDHGPGQGLLGGSGPRTEGPVLLNAAKHPCRGLFPWQAETRHGEVTLALRVDAEGHAKPTRVVTEQPSAQGFATAATTCAERLRFSPQVDEGGRAVNGSALVELVFDRP